jgi:hypothetical protein
LFVEPFVEPLLFDDCPVPMAGIELCERLRLVDEEAASRESHRHLVLREGRIERREMGSFPVGAKSHIL